MKRHALLTTVSFISVLMFGQPYAFKGSIYSLISPAFSQSPSDHQVEASQYRSQARELRDSGNMEAALRALEAALEIYQEIGDLQGELDTLMSLGATYSRMGNHEQEIEQFQRAVLIANQLGDSQLEYSVLHRLIGAIEVGGHESEAIEYYHQALALAETLGDEEEELYVLNALAAKYGFVDDYDRSIQYYQQALSIAQTSNQIEETIEILLNIGDQYKYLTSNITAIEYYQQSLALAEANNHYRHTVTALERLSSEYRFLGEFTTAIDYTEALLSFATAAEDQTQRMQALRILSNIYEDIGDNNRAEFYAREASRVAETVGIQIDGLRQDIFENDGIDYVENPQQVPSTADQSSDLQQVLDELLSLIAFLPGNSTEREMYSQEALSLAQALGDSETELELLLSSGVWTTDESKNAVYLQRALETAQASGDRQTELEALTRLPLVVEDTQQQIDYYEQALGLARDLGDRQVELKMLEDLGRNYNLLSYEDSAAQSTAIDYFQQALDLSKSLENSAVTLRVARALASIYHYSDYDDPDFSARAVPYYQQGINAAQQRRSINDERHLWGELGLLLTNIGQYPEAEHALREAIQIQESQRVGLDDTASIFLSEGGFTRARDYSLLQEVLVAQDEVEAALEIAERGRARAFADLISSRIAPQPMDASNSPLIEPPDINQIKRIAREHNATLVQYSVIEDFTAPYIWVVKPTGEVFFRQADFFDIQEQNDVDYVSDLVEFARQSMGVRGGFEPVSPDFSVTTAQQTLNLRSLHRLLIEPIKAYLPDSPDDRVIFIPHRDLFLVPFPALMDEAGTYLIENHTILTAPSIQVLDLSQQQRKAQGFETVVEGQDLLVIGNPTMPAVWDSRTSTMQSLSNLPGAEAEARDIASFFNTTALLGESATETLVKERIGNARIVHLATHGLLEYSNPQESGVQDIPGAIALTPGNGEDGLLTSAEIIEEFDLNAELVVLSACDTGLGQITGDGVIGLSRSLIAAGTPSVVVSLWSVPDAPTAELMTEFYRQMQQGQDKAQALRLAMLETIQTHPNPRDWAAFTLIGSAGP